MLSAVTLGSGEFTYKVDVGWEKLPPGYQWREVAAVAVDAKDRVYVLNRGPHPMIVFDKDGNFRKSWGEGVFSDRPHGLTLGPDETLFCTDDGDHTVRKCTLDGEVLMTIGIPGRPSPPYSGQPFNRCTHVAVDSDTGEFYVSDGYGNSHIHKYSPDGRLLFTWGGPGCDPGEFNLPHNIVTDRNGYVYVADRENHRVQVFDRRGKYQTQWNNLHRTSALCICRRQHVFIGEIGPGLAINRFTPNLGPRITVVNLAGERQARIGHLGHGLGVGQFISPHGLCIDSEDSIYVAEVSWTNISHFEPPPERVRSLQKLVRVHSAEVSPGDRR